MDQQSENRFEQQDGVKDWRAVDAGVSAWFAAPSLTAGAVLVRRVASLVSGEGLVDDGVLPDVDLRAGGVRVRIGATGRELTPADVELARAVSAAAHDLGLAADPSALQSVRIAIGTTDQPPLASFWQTVLDYRPDDTGGLADPLRRDPAVSFHPLERPRPLRDRFHVDVVRAPDAVEAVRSAVGGDTFGAYGLTLADADGNEVDVVPGDRLPDGPDTSDWWALFGAMTFYPVTSAAEAGELACAVAGLADDAGTPLLVDLRPDGVTIDSGKDQWEDDEEAGRPFAALAGRIQTAAHDLGHSADPTRLRFVQLGLDAVDVPAVQAFWTTLLGYRDDPRPNVTDVYDPRRLGPVIMFQTLDPQDDRRGQRNRIHLDLAVPDDQVSARVEAALAAGGRILADDAPGRRTLADPEGNEVTVIAGIGRQE